MEQAIWFVSLYIHLLITVNDKKSAGDVLHVKVLGNHVIILESLEAVNDLFEKRSSIYSDRPRMPMLVEL